MNAVEALREKLYAASTQSLRVESFDLSIVDASWVYVCRTCKASCVRPSFRDLGIAMAKHALEHAQ